MVILTTTSPAKKTTMIAKLVVVFLGVCCCATTAETTSGKYFPGARSASELESYAFPEESPETSFYKTVLPRTSSLGVSFSGGGSRAFSAALGQVGALREAGIWPLVRYATGTSGGSWALAGYTWRNRSADELLGPVVPPENLTKDALEMKYSGCARSFPSKAEMDYVNVRGEDWLDAVFEVFLGPAGVPKDGPLSSSPRYDLGGDPFPLFSMTLIGPATDMPRLVPVVVAVVDKVASAAVAASSSSSAVVAPRRVKSELRILTSCPLYVGTPLATEVDYGDATIQVGGFVEPQLFGCDGLEERGTSDEDPPPNLLLETRDPRCSGLTVGQAAGFSSFYSGLGYANVLGPVANLEIGLHRTYFGADLESTERVLFSDGGNTENVHLSGLLQRRVTRIIAFYNTVTPLNLTWDPLLRDPTSSDVADDLADFFGLNLKSEPDPTYDYRQDQVFPASDFPKVAQALQASVRAGLGGVATFQHETVQNDALGVPPGLKVNVTWVYLSTSSTWFDALPRETKLAIKKKVIEFANFPHFTTLNLLLTPLQVNALTSLTSWVLLQNFHTHLEDVISIQSAGEKEDEEQQQQGLLPQLQKEEQRTTQQRTTNTGPFLRPPHHHAHAMRTADT